MYIWHVNKGLVVGACVHTAEADWWLVDTSQHVLMSYNSLINQTHVILCAEICTHFYTTWWIRITVFKKPSNAATPDMLQHKDSTIMLVSTLFAT